MNKTLFKVLLFCVFLLSGCSSIHHYVVVKDGENIDLYYHRCDVVEMSVRCYKSEPVDLSAYDYAIQGFDEFYKIK